MPTDKRHRQREGREARREAARAAQKRAARRRQIISIVALFGVILVIAVWINRSGSDDESASDETVSAVGCPPASGAKARVTKFEAPPKMCISASRAYSATVETDVGSFTIELDAKKAPKTVNNFVVLARYRAYEGVPFHRVIPGFVVQGGDIESGNGSGGPGYEFADELPEPGEYAVGSVAMANSGPNTNGSQFFVVTGEQGVALPPSYSLFGTVTEGLDVVKAIEAEGSPEGTPTVTHKITKVTIIEKKG